MQITVQYVGDMLCEACSRHSGVTTRFVRKDLSLGSVRRATVFEPARKTPAHLAGQLRRTRELVRTRWCPLCLCGAILPAFLAASHLLGFHPRRRVLDTTYTRVGG